MAQGTEESAAHHRGAGMLGRLTGSKELGILLVLISMVAFIGVFNPGFLSIDSLSNAAQRASWYGIMALGIVFLLSMGEIDLSIGALYAVCINASAIMMSEWGWDPWIAATAGIVIGLALGAFNGVLANVLGLPAIIITLGTLSLFRGLALIISGGRFVYGIPRGGGGRARCVAGRGGRQQHPRGLPQVHRVLVQPVPALGLPHRVVGHPGPSTLSSRSRPRG